MTTYSAIPTMYDGVRYRSRLEARWAAFFNRSGTPFEYEPFDLKGYIPDFVLRFPSSEVLVEIKPCEADFAAACSKIDGSGWVGVAVVACSPLVPVAWLRVMPPAAPVDPEEMQLPGTYWTLERMWDRRAESIWKDAGNMAQWRKP